MAEKIDAIKEELTATPTEALEAFVEKYACLLYTSPSPRD